MSDIAVEVNRVYKKFHRGELHDSLRDLVPTIAKRILGRGPRRDQLEEDDFWALNDVSFQVNRGELLGIIGANGAGKSTMLKILSNILKPTRGSVRVNGRLRALIEVAAGFHGDLTGRENVYLNGSILGMKKREIDAKFDEIVEFSGIEPFLDTPVKRYSSGMFARLGFAVAAHLDPEVLIVDEVLAVGDAEFQAKCLGKMDEVRKAGRTVLFVSHNMGAVCRLTERTIVLTGGRISFDGPTNKGIKHYLTANMAETLQSAWQNEEYGVNGSHADFTAIRSCDCQGRPVTQFDGHENIYLEFDFAVTHPISAQVAYRLNSDDDSATIFSSALADKDMQSVTRLSPGRYRAICRIPAPFLPPGTYYLLAAINSREQQHALVERVLRFRVTEVGSLTQFDNRLGAVAPLLNWDLQLHGQPQG